MNSYEYYKEAIRQRVGIRQVVERYTDRRMDKRGFCSCPLHREKTASFKVDDQKQLYYCFGCGAGGDIFKFVQEYLGVDFKDAVKQIDRDFALGITGERISVRAQNAVREARKKKALELQRQQENNAIYSNLCAQYQIVNTLLVHLKPLTASWGDMLTRKAWLEQEMDRKMEEMCR